MLTNGSSALKGIRWWEHPERKCINDLRFTDLPRGRNAKEAVAELLYLCMQCPVISECHKEAVLFEQKDVVQGGALWR